MRKAIFALVTIVALLTAYFVGRYFAGPAEAPLALQKYCADAAAKMLQNTAGDNYMTHYNVAKNKCFVLVQSNGLTNDGEGIYTKSTITDVFEHLEYGVFDGTKKREAMHYTPALCRMLEDDGKWGACKTTPEWEAFAKRLMQN